MYDPPTIKLSYLSEVLFAQALHPASSQHALHGLKSQNGRKLQLAWQQPHNEPQAPGLRQIFYQQSIHQKGLRLTSQVLTRHPDGPELAFLDFCTDEVTKAWSLEDQAHTLDHQAPQTPSHTWQGQYAGLLALAS